MQWTDRVGRRVKLRDLHIFLAVVHSGSMAKAAAQLAVSQPVVSKTIAELEHALGVRLFDRTFQGVEPTAYGRAFITCGTAVFDDMRRGVQQIEFLADPTAGRLRVGTATPLVDGLVPAESDNRAVIGTIERSAFGLPGDPRIARRAIDPVRQRARRDLPGERMFASTATDEKDVHERLLREEIGGRWCSMAPICRNTASRRVWTGGPTGDRWSFDWTGRVMAARALSIQNRITL